ncbi:MAG: TIGR04133 family radical SAM/SPASM protein [Prevotella sp.]|nr:TIGR04133 family radical SAM/SPASM protein [Prevotella sp.]
MKPTPLTLRKKLGLELWRQREQNIRREHPLRQLFWESTLRCDLKCRHCGSDCKMQSEQRDMPKEDFFRVLDSVAAKTDPHKVFVIVSGGEPLMRRDLEECGAGIYGRGFPWGMVTNALHLTPERYHNLLRAGMHSMTISLDGLEADHNWMRGHCESFRMVSQAIDMLVATRGFTFDIVTCVTQRNYEKLDEIRDFLIAKGVKRWRLFTVFPVGRAAHDPMMRLSSEQFSGVFHYIKRTRDEGRIRADYGCEGFLGNYEGEVRNLFFSCQAGVTVGSVLADGSISACTSLRANYHQGNIYEDDFMNVWERRYQPYRDRRWMRTGDCRDCHYWRYCQGNGMHLRDDDGRLLLCHLKRLQEQ